MNVRLDFCVVNYCRYDLTLFATGRFRRRSTSHGAATHKLQIQNPHQQCVGWVPNTCYRMPQLLIPQGGKRCQPQEWLVSSYRRRDLPCCGIKRHGFNDAQGSIRHDSCRFFTWPACRYQEFATLAAMCSCLTQKVFPQLTPRARLCTSFPGLEGKMTESRVMMPCELLARPRQRRRRGAFYGAAPPLLLTSSRLIRPTISIGIGTWPSLLASASRRQRASCTTTESSSWLLSTA